MKGDNGACSNCAIEKEDEINPYCDCEKEHESN